MMLTVEGKFPECWTSGAEKDTGVTKGNRPLAVVAWINFLLGSGKCKKC